MNIHHPLVEVSEHIRNESAQSRVAAIFDLDSTLFCVSPRSQAILRSLGQDPDFSTRFQQASELLKSIEVLPTDYGIKSALERTQFQVTPELATHVRDYWRQHFFSSHFLNHDELYPSADEYVRHLHYLGAHILYLTGRGELSMRDGTRKALDRWHLPLYSESDLLMKPSTEESDEHFKVTALRKLAHAFDHIWFFENEPVIIHEVRKHLPQIHIVFVKSVHSGKASPPTDLRAISPDFLPGLPFRKA